MIANRELLWMCLLLGSAILSGAFFSCFILVRHGAIHSHTQPQLNPLNSCILTE